MTITVELVYLVLLLGYAFAAVYLLGARLHPARTVVQGLLVLAVLIVGLAYGLQDSGHNWRAITWFHVTGLAALLAVTLAGVNHLARRP